MPEIAEQVNVKAAKWWETPSLQWAGFLRRREEQVFLVLTLLIGALVGLTVVAFIVLTEHAGARIYPAGGVAPPSRPVGRLAGDGLSALQIFSRRSRQRRAANESGAVRTRRLYFAGHRVREVFLHLGDAGERDPTWPRGS